MSFRKNIKEFFELFFWRIVFFKKKTFNNDYYAFFFTQFWDKAESFYTNKKVLDIGCGPRGSLEWANMTTERVGLDPLAEKYQKAFQTKHQMKYVKGVCENIPFPNNYFDVITTFNSFDHVDDLKKSANEIMRVLIKGGTLLLVCDIHTYPTLTEPHNIGINPEKDWFPELNCIHKRIIKRKYKTRFYENLRHNETLNDLKEDGIVVLEMIKS